MLSTIILLCSCSALRPTAPPSLSQLQLSSAVRPHLNTAIEF